MLLHDWCHFIIETSKIHFTLPLRINSHVLYIFFLFLILFGRRIRWKLSNAFYLPFHFSPNKHNVIIDIGFACFGWHAIMGRINISFRGILYRDFLLLLFINSLKTKNDDGTQSMRVIALAYDKLIKFNPFVEVNKIWFFAIIAFCALRTQNICNR